MSGTGKIRNMMARMVGLFEAGSIHTIGFFVRLMPASLAYGFARILGAAVYALDATHRKITHDNLLLVYGAEMPVSERRKIARSMFCHMAMNAIEFLRIPLIKKKKLDEIVSIEGRDNLDSVLKKGKGAIFISGHFGNWELLGPLGSLLGVNISLVVQPIKAQSQVDDIVTAYRSFHGTGIIRKKMAALPIMRQLARGNCVGILIDQRTRRNAVMLDFLGHPASMTTVPAEIAARNGTPVMPVFALRDRPGHIKLIFGKEIEIRKTSDPEADAIENTRRFQKVIEDQIRAYPEQWLWAHERWKQPKPRHLRGYFQAQQENHRQPTLAD
ncbi:MAG: lysophospholipid acyltransferase family protein [Candidatus Hydrogenedentes bacterium]|nr:lysophospholipid acyltransferase family protein [Candidatus Hydrogenedentota bacterium]